MVIKELSITQLILLTCFFLFLYTLHIGHKQQQVRKERNRQMQEQQKQMEDYNTARTSVENCLQGIRDHVSFLQNSDLPFFEDEEKMIVRIRSMADEAEQALNEGLYYDFDGNLTYMLDTLKSIYDKASQRENRYYQDAYDAKRKREQAELENERARQVVMDASFFSGCNDVSAVKKRYRDLCKVYHPDMGNGDSATFECIQTEYEKLLKTYK